MYLIINGIFRYLWHYLYLHDISVGFHYSYLYDIPVVISRLPLLVLVNGPFKTILKWSVSSNLPSTLSWPFLVNSWMCPAICRKSANRLEEMPKRRVKYWRQALSPIPFKWVSSDSQTRVSVLKTEEYCNSVLSGSVSGHSFFRFLVLFFFCFPTTWKLKRDIWLGYILYINLCINGSLLVFLSHCLKFFSVFIEKFCADLFIDGQFYTQTNQYSTLPKISVALFKHC